MTGAPALPPAVTAPQQAHGGRRVLRNVLVGALFTVLAAAVALVRLRTSPLYPPANDVNSDVFVYQVVGNAWVEGRAPYRDVFDVKGPFLFLLFGLFALVRPWSMAAPLVALVLLALASLSLSLAIARMYVRGWAAVACAAAACLVLYLGVSGVPTSFSCEELAVPGVLLMLWLAVRSLRGERVATAWWLLDGAVMGVLFWSKYQVVAPWFGMVGGMLLLVARRQVGGRRLGRVVLLHVGGFLLATVAVLAWYAGDLTGALSAYFVAKTQRLDLASELPAQAEYLRSLVVTNPAAVAVLGLTLVVFLVRTARGVDRESAALAVAFVLSVWASIAFVRHAQNLFVPIAFAAVALPQALGPLRRRRPVAARVTATGLLVVSLTACAAPLGQSIDAYHLLQPAPTLTCYHLPDKTRDTGFPSVSVAFSTVAGDRPILSVGLLSSARSSYAARVVPRLPFQFSDPSWSLAAGAESAQAQQVRSRSVEYVWVRVPGLDVFDGVEDQVAHTTYLASQPGLGADLVRGYRPVLSCNNDLLLKAR